MGQKLAELLEIDAMKLFFTFSGNSFNRNRKKLMSEFFNNLIIYEKNLTIIKRKKFIYLNKLLVLRNLFKECDQKSFKIIKRIYFYKWSRILNEMNTRNNLIFLIRKLTNKSNRNVCNKANCRQIIFTYFKRIYYKKLDLLCIDNKDIRVIIE